MQEFHRSGHSNGLVKHPHWLQLLRLAPPSLPAAWVRRRHAKPGLTRRSVLVRRHPPAKHKSILIPLASSISTLWPGHLRYSSGIVLPPASSPRQSTPARRQPLNGHSRPLSVYPLRGSLRPAPAPAIAPDHPSCRLLHRFVAHLIFLCPYTVPRRLEYLRRRVHSPAPLLLPDCYSCPAAAAAAAADAAGAGRHVRQLTLGLARCSATRCFNFSNPLTSLHIFLQHGWKPSSGWHSAKYEDRHLGHGRP